MPTMGGLLYKDYDGLKKEIFEEDTHGIVHEALKEARAVYEVFERS